MWPFGTKKRLEELEAKIERFKIMLEEDNRYLNHDKTSKALTERYLDALNDDWVGKRHTDIVVLRERLGLTPNYKRDASGLASDLNRELEAFKRGARAMFDALAMMAANHWHANEAINDLCNKEKALVMAWAEDALEEVDPEDCATWRDLTALGKENYALQLKVKELEAKL